MTKRVWGWAQVSHNGAGRPAFDTDNQAFADEEMVIEAWAAYLSSGAPVLTMHGGPQVGTTRFAFPLLPSIAQSMGIKADKYGVLVGLELTDSQAERDVENGLMTGLSIGGSARFTDAVEKMAKVRAPGTGTHKQIATALNLVELSIVTMPAQKEALISLLKSRGIDALDILQKQKERAASMLASMGADELRHAGDLYQIATSDPAQALVVAERDAACGEIDRLTKARIAATGERYTEALAAVSRENPGLYQAASRSV
ncbi:HK97 family phage prohead protease [Aeromonas bestiarum]|uniref:HK97 family phage prohead protease n=1 Tax=Aeromonas bestiarum TaxID=105751 RepID=UPI0005037AA3|nr:HK97 family phage prohead protease [Aeromonas bestiarum]KFN18459.1 hypothetical protein JM66_15190 [Aeromonas bestiarum]